MGTRLELHNKLVDILGSFNVYFQPPATVMLKYPCIIYSRQSAITDFADNNPYKYTKRYQVTHISTNPDSDIPDKIAMMPMCLFDRWYAQDNLNHDVFNLYF